MFSSNSSQVSSAANYIEDVFSTYLYTGNSTSGGTQTITNNVDLSTYGGMVWIKGRSAASDHILTDTTRGAGSSATNNQALASNLTSAEDLGGSSYDYLSSFSTTGFVVTQGGTSTATRGANYNNVTYASWTFRKQAKFFDVVTYTGNGANRTISHNLGSVPGCIIVKRTDTTGAWAVYHRSLANTEYMVLNTTAAKATGATYWNSTTPTSTVFSLGTATDVNASGGTYVAYLFAHDAGGFGTSGTDNVISCGSYNAGAGADITVDLGYEPQWALVKRTDTTGNWFVYDTMRGFGSVNPTTGGFGAWLYANLTDAETTSTGSSRGIYARGLDFTGQSGQYIYIAIRRGPMKTPTSGTSVYEAVTRTGTGANATVTTGFPVDLFIVQPRTNIAGTAPSWINRLAGGALYLRSSATFAEAGLGVNAFGTVMNGVSLGGDAETNYSPSTFVN